MQNEKEFRRDKDIVFQNLKLLVLNPKFQKDVAIIRKSGKPLNMKLLKPLMRKYKLHSGWTRFLNHYIKTNKINASFDPEPVTLIHMVPEEYEWEDDPTYVFKIYSSVTIQDINYIWKQIKKFIGNKTKLRPQKEFDRNVRIYEYYLKGKSSSEIHTLITKEYRQDLDLANIAKIISEFNNHYKIPHKERIKLKT